MPVDRLKEAIRVFGLLKPNGNGARLILCLSDGEETVRIAALKLLTTGQYSAPFSQWTAVLSDDTFLDRALSEKRGVYQAIRATCGDEAVPYWQGLFTEWAWTNRKKKEECAVLAAEALGPHQVGAALEGADDVGVVHGGADPLLLAPHAGAEGPGADLEAGVEEGLPVVAGAGGAPAGGAGRPRSGRAVGMAVRVRGGAAVGGRATVRGVAGGVGGTSIIL